MTYYFSCIYRLLIQSFSHLIMTSENVKTSSIFNRFLKKSLKGCKEKSFRNFIAKCFFLMNNSPSICIALSHVLRVCLQAVSNKELKASLKNSLDFLVSKETAVLRGWER